MDEIKDLAGCRVVFLTNSQVERFNNTGALHENFEVVSLNVHHPVPGTDTETRLFDSTNFRFRGEAPASAHDAPESMKINAGACPQENGLG